VAQAPARAAPVTDVACVRCHSAPKIQLATSRHGLAAGPGLLGQLPTRGPHVGSGLACLLCHAPGPDQAPFVSVAALPADGGPGVTPTEAASAAITAAAARPNPRFDPHAEALGVRCTACHLQGGRVVGPRARSAPHAVARGAAFDGVTLCAACHQFGAASAVNGKPLENTVAEYRSSSWAASGASCVSCHMPFGKHLFQGIHTPSLVAASVEVTWSETGTGQGTLSLTNTAVGHDFPTYATPRVVMQVQPEDARGAPVGEKATLILGRAVHFEGGAWREAFDTRVPPGQTRALHCALKLSPSAVRLHATVRVMPDAAYVPLYRSLAARALPSDRARMIRQALARAGSSAYTLFDAVRPAGGRDGGAR